MEKNDLHGFDSRERYESVSTLVYNALVGLAVATVEMTPKTKVITITAEYLDGYLDMDFNLFDGLFSVVKYNSNGDEMALYEKTDLDIMRRIDLVSEELIKVAYTEK